ncbi:hypothetical protein C7271_02920 [filamentous cyanobacterium CCP5]|nr:hypothetical protein C7271_02920 [filamentous cyanobacterium CCP5]
MLATPSVDWQEQVQIALAVGNEGLLRRILIDSWPAAIAPSHVGSVRADVAVPVGEGRLDVVLTVERTVCALAGSRPDLPSEPVIHDHDHLQFLTGCVSKLYPLVQNQSLSKVVELLSRVGFSEAAMHQILNLPYHAWYKSWWYQADGAGSLSIPFQRFIRSRRYGDGTLTLHYKDYYSQEPPGSFVGETLQLPLVIRQPQEGFMATLERVNRARQALSAEKALLVVDEVTPIEVEGFAHQNVSLYSIQSIPVSPPADCYHCTQATCSLQGQLQSPVQACRGFLPEV